MQEPSFFEIFRPAFVFALGIAGLAYVVLLLRLRPLRRDLTDPDALPRARVLSRSVHATDDARRAGRWMLSALYATVGAALAGALALWLALATMLIAGWAD